MNTCEHSHDIFAKYYDYLEIVSSFKVDYFKVLSLVKYTNVLSPCPGCNSVSLPCAIDRPGK